MHPAIAIAGLALLSRFKRVKKPKNHINQVGRTQDPADIVSLIPQQPLYALNFLPPRLRRLFACDCLGHQLKAWTTMFPQDTKVPGAIEAVRKYLNGDMDADTLKIYQEWARQMFLTARKKYDSDARQMGLWEAAMAFAGEVVTLCDLSKVPQFSVTPAVILAVAQENPAFSLGEDVDDDEYRDLIQETRQKETQWQQEKLKDYIRKFYAEAVKRAHEDGWELQKASWVDTVRAVLIREQARRLLKSMLLVLKEEKYIERAQTALAQLSEITDVEDWLQAERGNIPASYWQVVVRFRLSSDPATHVLQGWEDLHLKKSEEGEDPEADQAYFERKNAYYTLLKEKIKEQIERQAKTKAQAKKAIELAKGGAQKCAEIMAAGGDWATWLGLGLVGAAAATIALLIGPELIVAAGLAEGANTAIAAAEAASEIIGTLEWTGIKTVSIDAFVKGAEVAFANDAEAAADTVDFLQELIKNINKHGAKVVQEEAVVVAIAAQ